MTRYNIQVTTAAMECPAAINFSISGVSGEKLFFTRHGDGNTIDDLVEEILLSVIHNTPMRTITAQLDLSMNLKTVNPLTDEKIEINLRGKPDIIINTVTKDGIQNKLVEVKYYPSDDIPIPQHVRQVSLYSIMYYATTKRRPETWLQYYLTNDTSFIKKLLIENASNYPTINSSFVKNFKVPQDEVIKNAKGAIYNVARAIALSTMGTPYGTFECHLCPYYKVCRAAHDPLQTEILSVVNYENMVRQKFVVPSNTDEKVREIAIVTNKMYLDIVRQLYL